MQSKNNFHLLTNIFKTKTVVSPKRRRKRKFKLKSVSTRLKVALSLQEYTTVEPLCPDTFKYPKKVS